MCVCVCVCSTRIHLYIRLYFTSSTCASENPTIKSYQPSPRKSLARKLSGATTERAERAEAEEAGAALSLL